MAIGIFQFLAVALSFLLFFGIAGQPGSEFVALLFLVSVVPVLAIIALINFLTLPFHMYRNRPKGKTLFFFCTSLGMSLVLALYGVYSSYQIFVVLPEEVERSSAEFRLNIESNTNAVEQKTTEQLYGNEEEVLELLAACKVEYFVGQAGGTPKAEASTQQWLEIADKSESGFAISDNSPVVYVFASESKTVELLEQVREYRESCYDKKKLYITVDDWIETEYPIGTWTRVKL
jgi:hypothetical protein